MRSDADSNMNSASNACTGSYMYTHTHSDKTTDMNVAKCTLPRPDTLRTRLLATQTGQSPVIYLWARLKFVSLLLCAERRNNTQSGISVTDLHRQLYMLPHGNKECGSNVTPHVRARN